MPLQTGIYLAEWYEVSTPGPLHMLGTLLTTEEVVQSEDLSPILITTNSPHLYSQVGRQRWGVARGSWPEPDRSA